MKLNYADFHELSIMRERIMTISNEAYNSNPPYQFSFTMILNKYSNELENIKVRCEEILTKTDQKEGIYFLLSISTRVICIDHLLFSTLSKTNKVNHLKERTSRSHSQSHRCRETFMQVQKSRTTTYLY